VGRSGPLTFVAVHHQILQRGAVLVDEPQDLFYRPAADPPGQQAARNENRNEDASTVPAGRDERAIEVYPGLLFRFSALTYNAHRIHYDRDFARDAEGYPDLLTHGPLQALAMAEAARIPVQRRRRPVGIRLPAPLQRPPEGCVRPGRPTTGHAGSGLPGVTLARSVRGHMFRAADPVAKNTYMLYAGNNGLVPGIQKYLQAYLHAKSVAVLGPSDDPAAVAANATLVANLKKPA
jgi:hypothetical protein